MRVGVSNTLKAREMTVCSEERERSKAIGKADCQFVSFFDISKISIDHIRLDDGCCKDDYGESEEEGKNEPDASM